MTTLNISSFIWGIAGDVLQDVYVRGKYRDVILPRTVIRCPLPSLLGRDILNLWTMYYSPVTHELGFETDP